VELYTKAYEVFKSASATSTATSTAATTSTTATGAAGVVTQGGAQGGGGRQTLWIAYRIAETYRENGKYDMAVRWVILFLCGSLTFYFPVCFIWFIITHVDYLQIFRSDSKNVSHRTMDRVVEGCVGGLV
jgi:hypothetical protein